MEELGSRPSRAALVEHGCKGALLFTDYELTTVVDTVIMLLDSKCGKETVSNVNVLKLELVINNALRDVKQDK